MSADVTFCLLFLEQNERILSLKNIAYIIADCFISCLSEGKYPPTKIQGIFGLGKVHFNSKKKLAFENIVFTAWLLLYNKGAFGRKCVVEALEKGNLDMLFKRLILDEMESCLLNEENVFVKIHWQKL